MRLLTLLITCLLALSGPDDADILVALGRAEVYAEKASDFYKSMCTYMRGKYDEGETDIGKKDWEETIKPYEKKARMFMEMAQKELQSIIPAEPKTAFWRDVYEVYYQWHVSATHLKDMNFYQDEFLKSLGGYPSFLHMYLAISTGKVINIDKGCDNLDKIRQALATRIRQQLPDHSQWTPHITFEYIPLGANYKDFQKQLKEKGYKPIVQRELYRYGTCKELFLEGNLYGNPAIIHIIASCKTEIVFSVDVYLHGFIDQEEAIEEAEHYMKEERAKYDYTQKTDFDLSKMTQIIDMPDKHNKFMRYVCLPIISVTTGIYETKNSKALDEPVGNITSTVLQNTLNGEYIAKFHYYDKAAVEDAIYEAK